MCDSCDGSTATYESRLESWLDGFSVGFSLGGSRELVVDARGAARADVGADAAPFVMVEARQASREDPAFGGADLTLSSAVGDIVLHADTATLNAGLRGALNVLDILRRAEATAAPDASDGENRGAAAGAAAAAAGVAPHASDGENMGAAAGGRLMPAVNAAAPAPAPAWRVDFEGVWSAVRLCVGPSALPLVTLEGRGACVRGSLGAAGYSASATLQVRPRGRVRGRVRTGVRSPACGPSCP